jgi:hypothetical protein
VGVLLKIHPNILTGPATAAQEYYPLTTGPTPLELKRK